MSYLILLLLLPWMITGGQAQSLPIDEFNAGVKAYQQNQYHEALKFFLNAKNSGLNTTPLNYNLASVYYRLGQFAQSRRYFEILLSDPEVAFQAQYSLALIAHKTGNTDAAVELFEKSIELTDDPRLIALAKKQIDTLGGQSSGATKTWFIYFSPAYGHDTNIANTPASNPTDLSGSFINALLYSEVELFARDKNSMHLLLTHLSRDYQDNSDFDLSTSILGAEYRTLVREWHLDYGLEIGRSSFGDDDYLSQDTIKIASKKQVTSNQDLRITLRFENISSLASIYDFLEGHRTEIKAQYRDKNQHREYRIIYQLELNDRRDKETQNFSPTRHLIGLQYQNSFNENLKGGIKLDYRNSDYETTSIESRRDRRSRLGVHIDYQLNSNWTAKLDTLLTRNESSVDASEYRNRITTLSLSTLF